jgi:flagellar assembly protein FliH
MSTPAKKFLFDVDFARGAEAIPVEPTITLDEHAVKLAEAEEAAYRNGFAAAQAQGVAEAEQRIAAALDHIGSALDSLHRNLRVVEARLEAEAVEVAVAVAGKLAPELIAREPFAEIAALVTECFRHLIAAPHVVVRVSESLYPAARGKLDELASARGFEGRLVVLAEPELAPGDCRIEWADGGINRDRAAAKAAITEAVARYISARLALAH